MGDPRWAWFPSWRGLQVLNRIFLLFLRCNNIIIVGCSESFSVFLRTGDGEGARGGFYCCIKCVANGHTNEVLFV